MTISICYINLIICVYLLMSRFMQKGACLFFFCTCWALDLPSNRKKTAHTS
mgnify:CR=1 FL=1